MSTRLERLQGQTGRLFPILFFGSVVGTVVGFSILAYGKIAGWFPPESQFTWSHVLVSPPAAFAMLCGYTWLAVKWEMRRAAKRDATELASNSHRLAETRVLQ